jgi:NADH-quinone oxidoreductase subunit M
MGFIILGLFSLNATGIDGAVIQMVNHGLTTGALFACVGVIYERYHTREMSELSGLWNRLPVWAFFLILSALGSAALPGLNGFVGEFPILLGMFRVDRTMAVLATLGMILGAYYLLLMLQKIVFGPLKEPTAHGHHDGHDEGHGHGGVRPLGWHEIASLTPIMVLIVLIGVFPKPFLDRIQPPLAPIVAEFTKVKPAAVASSNVPQAVTVTKGETSSAATAPKLIGD